MCIAAVRDHILLPIKCLNFQLIYLKLLRAHSAKARLKYSVHNAIYIHKPKTSAFSRSNFLPSFKNLNLIGDNIKDQAFNDAASVSHAVVSSAYSGNEVVSSKI